MSATPARSPDCRTRLHAERGQLDGVEDLRVPRAPAEIAGEGLSDLVARRCGILFEQGLGGQQDARSAIPALRRAELRKRLLERMQRAPVGQALDGGDLA